MAARDIQLQLEHSNPSMRTDPLMLACLVRGPNAQWNRWTCQATLTSSETLGCRTTNWQGDT